MAHQQRGNRLLDPAPERTLYDMERLMAELSEEPGPYNDLMGEHLDAARFYLLNSMPQEYDVTLQLAREALPDIEGEALRTRIAEFLQNH
jgi:hypothetical protein